MSCYFDLTANCWIPPEDANPSSSVSIEHMTVLHTLLEEVLDHGIEIDRAAGGDFQQHVDRVSAFQRIG